MNSVKIKNEQTEQRKYLRIYYATRYGDLDVVNHQIESGTDPSFDHNLLIRVACDYGKILIVERLLQDDRVDPAVCDNYPIKIAYRYGHLAIVERLKQDPRVDAGVLINL